jgi:hypothetical protein
MFMNVSGLRGLGNVFFKYSQESMNLIFLSAQDAEILFENHETYFLVGKNRYEKYEKIL